MSNETKSMLGNKTAESNGFTEASKTTNDGFKEATAQTSNASTETASPKSDNFTEAATKKDDGFTEAAKVSANQETATQASGAQGNKKSISIEIDADKLSNDLKDFTKNAKNSIPTSQDIAEARKNPIIIAMAAATLVALVAMFLPAVSVTLFGVKESMTIFESRGFIGKLIVFVLTAAPVVLHVAKQEMVAIVVAALGLLEGLYLFVKLRLIVKAIAFNSSYASVSGSIGIYLYLIAMIAILGLLAYQSKSLKIFKK